MHRSSATFGCAVGRIQSESGRRRVANEATETSAAIESDVLKNYIRHRPGRCRSVTQAQTRDSGWLPGECHALRCAA